MAHRARATEHSHLKPHRTRRAKCRLQRDKLALRFHETIPSTLDAIDGVVSKLLGLAREMECGEEELDAVQLALHEALVNAIVHGNRQDPRKKVTVRAFCQPERGMLLVVEDEGAGFNPKEVPDPTQAEFLQVTHGRGLYLMRLLVDRVRFSRSGRRVTMVKRLRR